MALEEYKNKRDFKRTAEPVGKEKSTKNIFVVQKHHATHLHYDFRIEVHGVLVSFALPKGFPYSDEKRLAVQTEDHPVEYANFSGIIPEGNYGAGKVEIYDKGTYENLRAISMEQALKQGKIEIRINGGQINGDYALIRLKPREKEKTINWLLFKMNKGNKDEFKELKGITRDIKIVNPDKNFILYP